MTREPLKVGDRCAVYTSRGRNVGTVMEISEHTGNIKVVEGDNFCSWVHPKQCRRLIPKKRREIWVVIDNKNMVFTFDSKEEAQEEAKEFDKAYLHDGPHRVTRFIEAPKEGK